MSLINNMANNGQSHRDNIIEKDSKTHGEVSAIEREIESKENDCKRKRQKKVPAAAGLFFLEDYCVRRKSRVFSAVYSMRSLKSSSLLSPLEKIIQEIECMKSQNHLIIFNQFFNLLIMLCSGEKLIL